MSEKHTFSGIMAQLTLACIICTLTYTMLFIYGRQPNLYYPAVLMIYGPMLYIIDIFFLRKQRTQEQLTILNAVLCVLFIVSVLVIDGLGGGVEAAFTIAFSIWLAVNSAKMAMVRPRLQNMISQFDVSAIVLVLFMAFLTYKELSEVWCIPAVIGFTAAVLGVISRRMGRRMGIKEWGTIGGVFIAIFAVIWVVITFVARPVGNALSFLANKFIAGISFVAGKFFGLLDSFAALFNKDADYTNIYGEPQQNISVSEQEMLSEMDYSYLIPIAVIAAIVILGLIVWAYLQVRKQHIGGSVLFAETKQTEGEKTSFIDGIKNAFLMMSRSIKVKIAISANKNKPLGLFYYAVIKMQHSSMHKDTGETPCEFLEKLKNAEIISADAAEKEPDKEFIQAMNEFINKVDTAFYAPAFENEDIKKASLIRKKLKAMRRSNKIAKKVKVEKTAATC